jgi:DNA-directed RNA polymerase specialized sigma24 family protein
MRNAGCRVPFFFGDRPVTKDADEPDDRSHGSITHCVGDLKGGDQGAAQVLWERYFDQLVRLARRRLALAKQGGADEDEEDAALSAFDSFCSGLAGGRFPRLEDRDELWRLLVVITARKASAQLDRRRALKRGGDRFRVEAAHAAADDSTDSGDPLIQIVARQPTPEFAAMVADETAHLLEKLGDEGLRQIALWRMEGYTSDEIADRLGCARRTVARRLDLIRQIWSAQGGCVGESA